MPKMPNEEASTITGSDTYSTDERTLYDHADDDGYSHGRPSTELSEPGHDILESEDERERLLTKNEGIAGIFSKKGVKIGKREPTKPDGDSNQRGKKGRNGEASALMYEMEEGVGVSDQSLSRGSSESDEQRLSATIVQRKARRTRIWRRIIIYVCIMVLFLVLFFVAYRVSKPSHPTAAALMLSNGTSLFAPTTILISLDGFRADFLYRGLTPTLNRFIQNGISPKYMLPSFPSVTFPNHYTMATGLYPEAHGIVGNTFWDPSLNKEFYYTEPEKSLQPFWWGGEPLWVTAERQNVRAAVHMWPGSEAHISHIEPAYVDKYNGSEVLPLKVDRILGLLDLPGPLDTPTRLDQPRPQLIAAYVPNVDGDGHKYGPNSTEIRQTIRNADAMLESILHGLQERNLTEIVNVVVVSDHGMATTDVSRLIQLEDLIDPNDLEHIDGWPLYGLRPKRPEDLDRLHQQLIDKAKRNPNIEVYLRDKDMPKRYHFSNNERIAPLWIVPKTGWAIVTKDEFDVEKGRENGDVYHPRGLHGYDHEHPLMRAIFVARGPAFPHEANSRVEPFQNIELYNIICDTIGIEPMPNNGTLRLPLKPVGLHTDPETPPNVTPADPVETSSILASTVLTSFASLATSASGLDDPMSSFLQIPPVTTPTTSAPPASSSTSESWWEWLTHKADNVEDWVEEFLNSHMPGKGDPKSTPS
ncbi:Phosphodiest-domain-containing protein [Lindgomyces ingoldianus]|uniref:Phosphodiest-domain-containing protein n=1 Tax=Lindgomyces ingoldianus TaxID=673940 RepID=A0ACB6QMC5_9PLEO|nr:Phosphodiest-domain-containing protein [Lindgomyces ingoldianus]KAF2468129.1 Phosphodiest-domain-containing protein [Lindgomyces ingoldianus]